MLLLIYADNAWSLIAEIGIFDLIKPICLLQKMEEEIFYFKEKLHQVAKAPNNIRDNKFLSLLDDKKG